MESLNSFKGYGKMDPTDDQSFRRKNRRRIIVVALSSIVLLAIVVGAVVGTVVRNKNKDATSAPSAGPPTEAEAIKAVCGVTQYPDSCSSSIRLLDRNSTTTDPEELFRMSLEVVFNELNHVASFTKILISKTNDESVKYALAVCQVMIEDSVERLQDSLSSMTVGSSKEKKISTARIDDLKTWLSTTLTDQETCLDAIREINSTVSEAVLEEVTRFMNNSTEFASNSLAIATKILGIFSSLKIPTHRKLLEDSAFPSWMRAVDRRLLQKQSKSVVPNVTVAKDGSGDFKTINEALEMVPKKSKTRFVIYVKAGVYAEYVNMNKSLQNVMIYGDGMYKTVVTGSRNFGFDRIPTFSTATFAVTGKNFIAKDIGFKNTAGPEKEQAVALRSGSDLSVFYRCSFDAYQDTLYPHSNRQFYRECDITGTVDFIFGNAAVVFQNCNILPRQPLPKQFVTITAQGKKDINQNTGISIHACTISRLDDLTARTYLGRPWKNYSTTIIMQTNIGSIVEQAGWLEWNSNLEPPNTIFYGEYQNDGPGASVDQRVTWAGYRPSITSKEALKFSVLAFIDGPAWIPDTGVTFESSLI